MDRTIYLARFLGLGIILTVLGMVANKQTAVETMSELFSQPALMWVTGVFTMFLGLAIVLAHNRWSGGPLPVVVTVYGWIALLKGVFFIWLPPAAEDALYQTMHFEQFFYWYFVVALIAGGFLTVEGFRTKDTS